MMWNKDSHFAGAGPGAGDAWSNDSLEGLKRGQRLAWRVALGLGAIAMLEAGALVLLVPLKTVVPYTVTVDRQTGYVETTRGLSLGPLSQNQAVVQSAVVQYVLARETFDATDLRENYRKIMLWSDGQARGQYANDIDRSNPASPLNLYPPTTVVSTTVKSVSLLSPTSALVRFETTRRDAGSGGAETRPYTAVLSFRYSNAAMRMEDRFLNPLGFQVLRYRRDAETAAPILVPAPAPTSAPATAVATPAVATPAVPAKSTP